MIKPEFLAFLKSMQEGLGLESLDHAASEILRWHYTFPAHTIAEAEEFLSRENDDDQIL